MQSVYWVFTLKCNDRCDHCYNNSSPTGETMDAAELLRVVPHLPAAPGRVILSGGEPTVEMESLEVLCAALEERYGGAVPRILQTNGDLLDDARLERILATGMARLDVVSMDRYHKNQGRHRGRLEALFTRHGMRAHEPGAAPDPGGPPRFTFWGATEDLWLGGNWARGRALETGTAKLDPGHDFCARWSGARGFLDDGSELQEVHVQLSRVYPCCPTTYRALGDAREEPIDAMLARVRADPDWRALNRGDPAGLGPDRAHAEARIRALGDVCLWCDEYLRGRADASTGPERPESQRTAFDV